MNGVTKGHHPNRWTGVVEPKLPDVQMLSDDPVCSSSNSNSLFLKCIVQYFHEKVNTSKLAECYFPSAVSLSGRLFINDRHRGENIMERNRWTVGWANTLIDLNSAKKK